MWMATFPQLSCGLHQAMVTTRHVSLFVAPWLFVIGAFRFSLWLVVFLVGGFRSQLFWFDAVPWRRSAVVLMGCRFFIFFFIFFYRRHPRSWNFNSVIPTDVIRIKSYVKGPFNPTGEPMWARVNKLKPVPKQMIIQFILSPWLSEIKIKVYPLSKSRFLST